MIFFDFPRPAMKFTLSLASAGLAGLLLTGCSFGLSGPSSGSDQSSSVSSAEVSMLEEISYEGTVVSVDPSSPDEGTYRLSLGDGQYLSLESSVLDLSSFLGKDVKATGTVRSTLDGTSRIMRVDSVQTVTDQVESSEAPLMVGITIGDTSSSSIPSLMSSSEAVSSLSTASAYSSSRASLPPPPPPLPPTLPSASSAGTQTDVSLKAASMARSGFDAARWTQQYCSSHIGFCVPIHRNWWFKSFGAAAGTLWHVEISSEEISASGDSPISVDFISGSLPGGVTDGAVSEQDGIVTGYRAWTGQRHFEIKAPLVLKAAVEFMTTNLKTYDGTQS
jgi:hypothetical protein